MGKRGTNQAKQLNLSIPVDAIGYWADRLKSAGIETHEIERFGTQRLEFAHPWGIPYNLVADPGTDDRVPYEGGGVPAEHAIRGAYGTTTSVREVGEMDFFITQGMRGGSVASEGHHHHQYQIGTDEGHGRMLEIVEEPDLPQGTWHFGEGTIHHHAFDVISAENQQDVKDWIVGLGFTDISEPKDRGYFFSCYCRSPRGPAGGAGLLARAGLPDRRAGRRARDAHVHPAALGAPARGDRSAGADRHRRDGRGPVFVQSPAGGRVCMIVGQLDRRGTR